MSNGAEPTAILTAMGAVETSNLDTFGLVAAYGYSFPDKIPNTFPLTVRWITRMFNYNEETGPTMRTMVGPQDATLHVNVFLILGAGNPALSVKHTAVNLWLQRLRDCYLVRPTWSGYWQSAKVLDAQYMERTMGSTNYWGLDHDVRILTTTLPTVGS